MRCTHCGAMIPDELIYCPECGMEVQIVPDYNPLEDVLVREVRGSVEDATRQIKTDDIRRYRREEQREYSNSTRVLSQGELDEIRARRSAMARQGRPSSRTGAPRSRQTTGAMRQQRQATGSMRQNTGALRQSRQSTGVMRDAEEKRRQQIARKKRAARKRRQRILIFLFLFLVFTGVLAYVLYQNSYPGQVRKGNLALQAGEYAQAENYFNRAISKNSKKAEAYTGLSSVYSSQEDMEGAESVFLTAIADQPSNVDLYKAAINFYMDSNQLEKISELLDNCEDSDVLLGVKEYVSQAPEFSLEEGTYGEVQEVSLTADGGTIYYTTDGSEPDTSSTEYTEPVLLNEGENIIKAISVNKKGIPSLMVAKSYTIEIPIEDAPAVTPSTGQYDTPAQITISVPEGYTAYYTLDNTEPSASSTLYTGPIDMPEGQTMFSAVLINKQGKATQVTKRNYVLELSE